MIDPVPASAGVRAIRRFRRAAGILVVVVGLVLLVPGIVLSVSQTWPTATGTVQSCTTDWTGTGSSRRAQYRCLVSWTDETRPRSATVDLGARMRSPGEQVTLRVHGDTATEDSPAWFGYAILALGLVLVAGGAWFTVRGFRARRRDP